MWFDVIQIRFAAQHRLHLTAFGAVGCAHFANSRAIMILSPCKNRRQVSHTVSAAFEMSARIFVLRIGERYDTYVSGGGT
jgi:hypothetical protein